MALAISRLNGSLTCREKPRVADHAHEQVVEIVRDAAGQHAQAIEPLAALELLLQRAAARPRAGGTGRRSRRAPARTGWPFNVVAVTTHRTGTPSPLACRPTASYDPKRPVLDPLPYQRLRGRRREIEDRTSEQRLGREAEDGSAVAVDVDDQQGCHG